MELRINGFCRSLSAGFSNGGFGGLFWVFIGTVTCYSTIVASLAEMTSMAPTSGGKLPDANLKHTKKF